MAAAGSNPNVKVPGATSGSASPATTPNKGAGYKLPSVNVIDPDANPTYGMSKVINAQITGAGTGGTGTDVVTPSPVVQISSAGLAKSLGVAQGSYVPSGTTVTPATGQNSLVVTAQKATAVNTKTDSYYTISGNGKTVNVISIQYDSWTPAQQFAFQQSQGLIPTDAQISFNADGSWGYTSKSAAAKQQANSGYTNGIPTDLYNTYLQNKNAYAAAGKPPPLNFDHTVDGQVTVTPYADPSKAVTYIVPTGTQLFFNNVKGLPVIDKLTDLKGNIILKADSQGNYIDNDIQAAINSGKLSTSSAVALFGTDVINKIMNSKPTSGYPSDYDQSDWDADKASGKIPKTATFVSYDATTGQVNFTLPSTYTQDDWDADRASGKIPKDATFVSYDAKTGAVNYTVPITGAPGYIADHPSGGGITAKTGAVVPVLTPAQAAALLAQQKAASAQVTNAKVTKSGINLSIANSAGKNLAKTVWNDIVNAAKSYNATHSGIAKVTNVNGKQTVVRTAPASGLPTVGGNVGEELTEAGELETSSGGTATPIVILAVLASVGIAAYSQRQNIENAVTHYKQTHNGQTPAASQVTLTDNTGNSVTLAQVANMNQNVVKAPQVLQHPTGEVQTQSILSSPTQTVEPIRTLSHPTNEVNMPSIESIPASGMKVESTETIPLTSGPEPVRTLQSTATASQSIANTPAVGKALTPQQLEHIWGLNGGGADQGAMVGASYLTAGSLIELDQAVLKAYENGTLTQGEMDEYNRAKARYLKAKGLSDSAVASATNSMRIPKSISKGKFIAAVSAATLAAIATANATKAQQATAIKQAIYISTGVQTQSAVEQITQTAQQIATQQAVKAGLQTVTQQAIKEATKTQTAEQIKEQTQEQVQEQTRAQTMEQAVSAETTTTQETEKAKTAEDEAELENEMTAVLAKPKNKKTPEESETITNQDLASATTWKAGFGWWYRFPNGQYRFLRQPPPGAKPVKPGKGSGYASVQTIRGRPIIDTRRMGVVTVTINHPGKQPGARGAIAYHATGQGKPGLSMTRKGKMVNIRGVGLASINKIPRGRVLRS